MESWSFVCFVSFLLATVNLRPRTISAFERTREHNKNDNSINSFVNWVRNENSSSQIVLSSIESSTSNIARLSMNLCFSSNQNARTNKSKSNKNLNQDSFSSFHKREGRSWPSKQTITKQIKLSYIGVKGKKRFLHVLLHFLFDK